MIQGTLDRGDAIEIENLDQVSHSLEQEITDEAVYVKEEFQEAAVHVENVPQEEYATVKEEIDIEEVGNDVYIHSGEFWHISSVCRTSVDKRVSGKCHKIITHVLWQFCVS